MKITEVRIKLMEEPGERLKAFCSITFDDAFVVRDLKIIEGASGPFVAMPSRKLTDKCPKCNSKNHLRSRFCNDCGGRLDENRASKDKRGRAKLHADIAHPINSACRERLQAKILEAFHAEVERSKQPGYVPPKLDEDEDFTPEFEEPHEERPEPPREVVREPPREVVREPAREVVREPEPKPAPIPIPKPAPAPEPQPEPEPEVVSEPVRDESDEDEDIRRLEEEVRRYEEQERREAEKKKDKKDDFASGLF